MRPTSSTGSATTTWPGSTWTGPGCSPSTRTSRLSGRRRRSWPAAATRRRPSGGWWRWPPRRGASRSSDGGCSCCGAVAAERRGDPAATALALDALELAARLGRPGLPLIRERQAAASAARPGRGHRPSAGGRPGRADVPGHRQAARRVRGHPRRPAGRRDRPARAGSSSSWSRSRGGRLTRRRRDRGAVAGDRPRAQREPAAHRAEPAQGRGRRRRRPRGPAAPPRPRRAHRPAGVRATTPGAPCTLAAGRSREAVSAARAALARYGGDLLPDDHYEPWAELPRERLRRQALSLLDLCAASAAQAGDLDEAVRCLERAIELAPDEEERYLTAARHLLTQGRRGAARAMVGRARRGRQRTRAPPAARAARPRAASPLGVGWVGVAR